MYYRIINRKKPNVLGDPGKYYACLVSTCNIEIEEIASKISASCTVTRHDCLAVLSALQEQIIYALQEGKCVHLGDVGNFHTVAIGSGTETKEEYKPENIKRLKVVFVPNTKLKNALSVDSENISFQRVKEVVVETTGTEEEPQG